VHNIFLAIIFTCCILEIDLSVCCH
jgi:hypothetical protein